mmetsp:Transcript_103070/g.300644  ORF Transcript_103070/g.300644 Transcript_103070/m.300644 type:complete len:139 (-) Transcript_103070:5-421(-)
MGRLAELLAAADHGPAPGEPLLLPAAGPGLGRGARLAEATAFLGKLRQPPPSNDDDRPGEEAFSIAWSGEWMTMRDLYSQPSSSSRKYLKFAAVTAGIATGGLLFAVPPLLFLKFQESIAKSREELAAPVMLAGPAAY